MYNEKGYNGWTNYETWVVALWLKNDQGSSQKWQEITLAFLKDSNTDKHDDGALTATECAVQYLSDILELKFKDDNPIGDDASVYADLLNSVISEIDWRDIAESFIEDAEHAS